MAKNTEVVETGSIINEEVSKRLKALREEKNWSQSKLADEFSPQVDRSSISNYEHGRYITIDTLGEYRRIFQKSIDWLLFGESTLSGETQALLDDLKRVIKKYEGL